MSEGGWREYRADDRVWAGQMTGQHGPVLRFMRHDAQREQLLQPPRSGKKGEGLKSYVRLSSCVRTSYKADDSCAHSHGPYECAQRSSLSLRWHTDDWR